MSRTDQPRTYYDLLDALKEEGCPVCRLAMAAVHRYMDNIAYELAADPAVRGQLRGSLGFCNEHAHQWLKQSYVLGTAWVYADVLEKVTGDLHKLTFRDPLRLRDGVASFLSVFGGRGGAGDESALLEPVEVCRACRFLTETEMIVVDTLLTAIQEPVFSEVATPATVICIPHLRLALRAARDEAAFKAVRDFALERQELLLDQLREIIRRHDYRFSEEPSGDEAGAGRRAVNLVAGAHGIE